MLAYDCLKCNMDNLIWRLIAFLLNCFLCLAENVCLFVLHSDGTVDAFLLSLNIWAILEVVVLNRNHHSQALVIVLLCLVLQALVRLLSQYEGLLYCLPSADSKPLTRRRVLKEQL